ncbi:MAG: AsnC family protein [Pseudomonadota bacterium]
MSAPRLASTGVTILWVGIASLGAPDPLDAAPDNGADPSRAHVAAQCAAFWEGAGVPALAAPFRQIAATAGLSRSETERRIDRLRPEMERLSADRATSERAQALWLRHAALCSG